VKTAYWFCNMPFVHGLADIRRSDTIPRGLGAHGGVTPAGRRGAGVGPGFRGPKDGGEPPPPALGGANEWAVELAGVNSRPHWDVPGLLRGCLPPSSTPIQNRDTPSTAPDSEGSGLLIRVTWPWSHGLPTENGSPGRRQDCGWPRPKQVSPMSLGGGVGPIRISPIYGKPLNAAAWTQGLPGDWLGHDGDRRRDARQSG